MDFQREGKHHGATGTGQETGQEGQSGSSQSVPQEKGKTVEATQQVGVVTSYQAPITLQGPPNTTVEGPGYTQPPKPGLQPTDPNYLKPEDRVTVFCQECGMGSLREDWQQGGKPQLVKQAKDALAKTKDAPPTPADVQKLIEQIAASMPKKQCDSHTDTQLQWDKDHRAEIDAHIKAAQEKIAALTVREVQTQVVATQSEPPSSPGRQYPIVIEIPPTSQLSAGVG